MSETIQLRQDGEPSENTTQYESPDNGGTQAVCAFYLANEVAEQFDEFIALEVTEEADVNASLDNITGANDDGNYGVYSTAGGAITGLYLSHDTLSAVTGEEAEPENAPDSVGLLLRPSDEDSFDEAAGVDEEEMSALVAGSADSDEGDDSDEEEVGIADEEIGLVDAE